jgi:hypothetical protein
VSRWTRSVASTCLDWLARSGPTREDRIAGLLTDFPRGNAFLAHASFYYGGPLGPRGCRELCRTHEEVIAPIGRTTPQARRAGGAGILVGRGLGATEGRACGSVCGRADRHDEMDDRLLAALSG